MKASELKISEMEEICKSHFCSDCPLIFKNYNTYAKGFLSCWYDVRMEQISKTISTYLGLENVDAEIFKIMLSENNEIY